MEEVLRNESASSDWDYNAARQNYVRQIRTHSVQGWSPR